MKKYKAETFDIWQSLPGPIPYEPLMFTRVDYEGRIDLDILIQAVTLSIRTIPHIACSFDSAENRPKWVERDLTGKDMVRAADAEDDIDKQLTDFLDESIDPATGPQLKILLIRRSDGDTLCAITTHRLCDAGGFKQYHTVLSGLYTALKNNKPVPDYPFYTRGTKPLFVGMKFREKMRILQSEHKDAFTSPKEAGESHRSIDKSDYKPYRVSQMFPAESFARLKSFAKAHNATVNDMIMALSARAHCAYTNNENISFPCTIDMRKFIPAGVNYGISNYSGLCMCHVSFKPGDSLADTLQQVSEQMRFHKSNNNVLRPTLALRLSFRFLPRKFLKRVIFKIISVPQFTFTNTGTLDPSIFRLDDLVIRNAHSAPGFSLAPQLLLNVITFNNCCSLDFNFYGSSNDVKMARALLDHIAAEVEDIV
jgi:NRPS condensation-like uncharacterized protein